MTIPTTSVTATRVRPTPTVGQSLPTDDGWPIVTGQLEFVTDLRVEGMLYGAIARADIPHARIDEINVTAARSMPGVVAVLVGADVPVNALGATEADGPVLADTVIRQVGDPVALIAAVDERTALAAAAAVRIRVTELPVVHSATAALAPDAPQLHEGGNIAGHIDFASGDVEAALAASPLVIERRVHTPAQEHVAIETPGGMADLEGDGVVIWCGSQNPGVHRSKVARALAIDLADVRLVSNPVGGAFGSRNDDPMPVYLAVLAWATRRPVHLRMTREDVMAVGPKRHPFDTRIRLGVDVDGHITASDMVAVADTGPYITSGPNVLKTSAELSVGPYRMPMAHFDGTVVFTNNANGGAFRGYGVPQVAFPLETAITEAAARLGIDPVELRLRNVLHGGDEHALYRHHVTTGLRAAETLTAVAEHPWWTDRAGWRAGEIAPWRRGTGIALAMKGVGLGSGKGDVARARLIVSRDGLVQIWAGPNHTGQAIGSSYAQVAADTLRLGLDRVRVTVGDSQLVPESGPTASSRSMYSGGSAVRRACLQLLERVREATGDDLIDAAACRALIAAGRAEVVAEFPLPEAELGIIPPGQLGTYSPHLVFGCSAQLARVEVNELTGELRVAGVVCAVDCGTAINPAGVIGQAEGGVAQGLGYAVMEERVVVQGRPRTTGLENYLIPTVRDVPPIETIVVAGDEPTGPMGAKGMSEVVVVPTAAAIAGGVFEAVGVLPDRLPITPERLLGWMADATSCGTSESAGAVA
ncbi:MAG: xanthine dehydrogenase family protein molybdopterin-binding subunit [Nakamurella sp.]